MTGSGLFESSFCLRCLYVTDRPAKEAQQAAMLVGYLAPEEHVDVVKGEIGPVKAQYGRLLLVDGAPRASYWSQNIWEHVEYVSIDSIKDAARKLTAIQRNWSLYPHECHRRAALIEQQLPYISKKPLNFPAKAPSSPMGSWTLLDEKTMLISAKCRSPYPNGELHFVEDHHNPPSRAYLKLWEALTRAGRLPRAGDKCLDLGACPGGWTWVLTQLGAEVVAVDRSPLDPRLSQSPLVTFRQGNAFSVKPADFEHVDWLVCDVICYPEKLYEYLQQWLESDKRPNFVCTLKFQGPSHYDVVEKFAQIGGSEIVHLHHNKHELTWINIKNSEK